MRRMLYLMYMPWGYIKQRPQFLAEQLSRYYQVSAFYKKSYRKDKMVRNEPVGGLEVTELFKIPLDHHSFTISGINNRIFKHLLKEPLGESDIVWLTDPDLYAPISDILPEDKFLVYDCMDDALEFPRRKTNRRLHQKIFQLEKGLCERSDLILVTSDRLKRVLVERYQTESDKVVLVSNAVSLEEEAGVADTGDDHVMMGILNKIDKLQNKITYIGCIADWFDSELIMASLGELKEITYVLVGINEVKIPNHERIVHLGPIEHRFLYRIMQESDLLVMPFKLNELILSTNPIKLYEYIYSAKPCIAVEYGETLKFEDYIYLYSGREEYLSLLKRYLNGALPPKKSPEECARFAEANTWQERGLSIHGAIESALTKTGRSGNRAFRG